MKTIPFSCICWSSLVLVVFKIFILETLSPFLPNTLQIFFILFGHLSPFIIGKCKCFLFLKNFIIHERHGERGKDIGRGRSRLPAGSLMWDSIPGPWDHDLHQKQTLNH